MKRMILMTLFAALLLSCSDNSGIDTTTIALKANKTSIQADGKDAITFTVIDQDGKDVTAQSSITVDGASIGGSRFTTQKEGRYIAIATYKNVDSNTLAIEATGLEEDDKKVAELELTADKVTILANSKDLVTFTVKDASGNDITEKAKFRVNNVGLSSNTYFTAKPGEHVAIAEWDGKISNEVVIQAMEPADINLFADKIKIFNSGNDEVTFTVEKQDGTDITAESTFTINDEPIEGNKFSSTQAGKYTVRASWNANESNRLNIEVVEVALEIKADKNTITADGLDMATFSLINTKDNNADLTSQATFFVDGKAIEGNSLITNKVGKYSITAKLLEYEAGPIEITAVDASQAKITSKVFMEDFTGDWCPNCPRVLRVMDDAVKTGKAVALAVHMNDNMQAPDGRKIVDLFGVTGYPSLVINRIKSTLAHSTTLSKVLSYVDEDPQVGAAMSAREEGGLIIADVTFIAKSNLDLKAVVILGENGIKGTQSGWPELKEHSHVYRASHNGQITGAAIEVTPGNPKEATYSFPIKSSYVANNCFVIVLITDASNNQVLNAQWVEVGQKTGY